MHSFFACACRYVTGRTVLAPKREHVAEINKRMLERMPGALHEHLSIDSAVDDASGVWSTELCNQHDPPGLQQHRLQLKVGAVVILIRNMRPELGMCNGTRLIIERIAPRLLTAIIITEGKHSGKRVFIPMITLQSHDAQLPYTLRRTQFPVRTPLEPETPSSNPSHRAILPICAVLARSCSLSRSQSTRRKARRSTAWASTYRPRSSRTVSCTSRSRATAIHGSRACTSCKVSSKVMASMAWRG